MPPFALTTTPAALVLEFTKDPMSFPALIDALFDRRYDGQILLDFRRGTPRSVAFPQLTRIPFKSIPKV
ncbi:hypothetical protein LCGC14_2159850 [marine sediment metagenome]|uniref:Uncharacterized protein n=1 Tax=marine sediment metagenome TaxID=412755 RepID=A0A0F9EFC5_9ZZZZ